MAAPTQTALVTESVSNLIGGVSQQADASRLPTQATEILNALLSPTEGLKKRPPSKYLQALTPLFATSIAATPVLSPAKAFTHMYNRDATEKYMVMIVDGDLKVVSLVDGSYKTVAYPDGKAYLTSSAPGDDFKAHTVGDYTFILNKTVEVDRLSTLSPAVVHEALVWVRQGDYGVTYSVTLDSIKYTAKADLTHRDEVTTEYIAGVLFARIPSGKGVSTFANGNIWTIGDTVTVTRTSTGGGSIVYTVKAGPDGTVEGVHDINRGICALVNGMSIATTGHIFAFVDDIFTDFGFVISNIISGEVYTWSISTTAPAAPAVANTSQTNTYYTEKNGSTLYIKRVDAADFPISATDGLGDQSIRAIKGQIQRFADLPSRAINGFHIEIIGEGQNPDDNFYAVYNDSLSVGTDGTWKESLKRAEHIALDPATMPHLLVREADGTFSFRRAVWLPRLVGDLNNSPFPSFYGFTIDDLFTYKSRLGFISGENIVLSQTGESFNLFRISVQQLLDEEMIDVTANDEEIARFNHAVPHEKEITLWSNKLQFTVSGNPVLTAKTITVLPTTSFVNSPTVKPIKVGKEIYFLTDRGSATQVSDFFSVVGQGDVSDDADDVTALIPGYAVGAPHHLTGSDSLKLLALATRSNTNDIYVYAYLWQANSLVQSAWSTWKFGNSGNVLAVQFMENKLILVIQRGTSVLLETIEILPTDVDSFSSHLTYLDCRMTGLPAAYADGVTTWTLPFAIPEDAAYPLKVTRKATASQPLTTELPYLIRPNDTTITAIGNFAATEVWIGFAYDWFVELSKLYVREQSQDGRVSATTDATTQVRKLNLQYDKTGYLKVAVLPTGRSVAYNTIFDDASNDAEGSLPVPVQCNNEKVTITFTNASHRPCAIQGMSWDAVVSQITRR